MSFWRSIGGLWKIKLTSADPIAAIAALHDAGIPLLQPEMTDALTWQFIVAVPDVKQVMKICREREEECVLVEKKGIFWMLASFRKRPILVLGMLFLLVLSLWVPSRVFFVQVEGNCTVPTKLILEQAELCGIRFGASRQAVRSQSVKNHLLAQLPQLQWAGIRTNGCVAVIRVHEAPENTAKNDISGVCSIVASRDSILDSVIVLQGNPLCKPGQVVKAGQVLISGYMDCGICIRAVRADGEILGRTQHCLTAVFPEERVVRGKIQHIEKKYSLIIGKKQINFFKDSGISDTSCVTIYEQKYITLPGGFCFPISIISQQRTYYETSQVFNENGVDQLSEFAKHYVLSQTQAGVIEHTQESFTQNNGCIWLTGVYGCLENIGMVRMEENIP